MISNDDIRIPSPTPIHDSTGNNDEDFNVDISKYIICHAPQYKSSTVPAPFTSKLLTAERDLEKESIIHQKFMEVLADPEYSKNPKAYVAKLEKERSLDSRDKWKFPEDDVFKKLKEYVQ